MNDKQISLLKAGVSTIPGIGSFITSIWSDIQTQHFSEFCDELEKEVKNLNIRIDDIIELNKFKDKYFEEFVCSVLEKIKSERTQEKRKAYRHVLLNCMQIKMSDYDYDLADKVIRIIDLLTRSELILLFFLKDKKIENELTEAKILVEELCEKMNISIEKLNNLAYGLELQNLESVFVNTINQVKNKIEKNSLTQEYYLTELGQNVLKYIDINYS